MISIYCRGVIMTLYMLINSGHRWRPWCETHSQPLSLTWLQSMLHRPAENNQLKSGLLSQERILHTHCSTYLTSQIHLANKNDLKHQIEYHFPMRPSECATRLFSFQKVKLLAWRLDFLGIHAVKYFVSHTTIKWYT